MVGDEPLGGVGRVQVTLSQVGVEVMLHPGLFTDAANRNVSVVPTVAEVGVSTILIPVTIVREADAVFVVSACAVAVTVTCGATVGVPLTVTEGSMGGAV
jgi:hypothetical protein